MSAKKMQTFFWQQLDDQRMEEKKRRERKEKRDEKLARSGHIIEYAKLVKFGGWKSIPKAQGKSQDPGKGLVNPWGKILFLFRVAFEQDKSTIKQRGSMFRVPLEQMRRRRL